MTKHCENREFLSKPKNIINFKILKINNETYLNFKKPFGY